MIRTLPLIMSLFLALPALAQSGSTQEKRRVILLRKPTSEASGTNRVDVIMRHTDGSTTARFTPVNLHAEELQALLAEFSSENGFVRAAGTFVLVRDSDTIIKEMEKAAEAIDVAPEPATVMIKVLWGSKGEATGRRDPSYLARSRVVTASILIGREFHSSQIQEVPFTKSIIQRPGEPTVTQKSFRESGVSIAGRIKRTGDRLDIELKIEVTGKLREEGFGTEKFEFVSALKNGVESVIGVSNDKQGADGKDGQLEMLVSAKVIVR